MSMHLLYQNGKVNSRNFFTFLDMYQIGKGWHDSSMTMTIEEIRRENAKWLANKCGGAVAFAELLDVTEARVSHLIGKNPVKNIGTRTARKIENVFDKPKGWLDTPNAWAQGDDHDVLSRIKTLFNQATEEGRAQILLAAELAEKNPPS
jgi:plasmid maintenance system antidote protein VapI